MRYFISLSFVALVLLSCVSPAFAEYDDNGNWIVPEDYDGTNIALEEIIGGFEFVDKIPDEVTYEEHETLDIDVGDKVEDIIENEAMEAPAMVIFSAPNPSSLSTATYLDIPDNPPSNAPFLGQWYITGIANGQRVTIYTGTVDGWGVDKDGYLYRLSGTATGQLYYGNVLQTSRLQSYSYPQYRTSTTGSQYVDLHIVPDASNVNIYSAFPEKSNSLGYTVPDYILLFSVGLIVVILISKKR